MPESLFAPRRFRRSYLIACFAGALILEGSLVGLAQIYAHNKSWDLPPVVTELDTGPVLGEPVQELILPKEDPAPTPDQPTPPPEETPPPDDTPPPTEEPDMTMDTPKPTAPPKSLRPSGTPFPANAKRGDHPQMGVVGGVPHAEKTTGTPGAKALGAPVHTPKPPYPYQARVAHLSGSGVCHVTFDGSGHVSSASMTSSIGSGLLDSNTVEFAKSNWTGPPNASRDVPITYTKPGG